MRAVTEESPPLIKPQGILAQLPGHETRGEMPVGSSPSRQRQPPCKSQMRVQTRPPLLLTNTATNTTPHGYSSKQLRSWTSFRDFHPVRR